MTQPVLCTVSKKVDVKQVQGQVDQTKGPILEFCMGTTGPIQGGQIPPFHRSILPKGTIHNHQ